jgi:hypothetical protein
MRKQWNLDLGVEQVARMALLVLGSVLAVAGLTRHDLRGLAVVALGIATITLAAILPRIERIRLFGKHGLDARLRRGSGR